MEELKTHLQAAIVPISFFPRKNFNLYLANRKCDLSAFKIFSMSILGTEPHSKIRLNFWGVILSVYHKCTFDFLWQKNNSALLFYSTKVLSLKNIVDLQLINWSSNIEWKRMLVSEEAVKLPTFRQTEGSSCSSYSQLKLITLDGMCCCENA